MGVRTGRGGRAGGVLLPREVPGYAEAQAAGTLPVAPDLPPALVVRPTAGALLRRLVGLALGGVAVLGWGLQRIDLDLAGPLLFLLLGAVALGCLVWFLRALSRVGDRSVAELQHGYTTLELALGGFWTGEGPVTTSGEMRAPWDYRGTWHLHPRDGRVLRAPDRGVDPPGMYPSPNRPGRTELWTGATWLGHFAD